MKQIDLFSSKDFERKIPLEFFGNGPQSFGFCWTAISETCSALANAKLNDWLKSAVRVYSYKPLESGNRQQGWYHYDDGIPDKYDTHQALLVCIEELPKKDCEHEGVAFRNVLSGCITHYECQKCHVKLEPLGWKAVE